MVKPSNYLQIPKVDEVIDPNKELTAPKMLEILERIPSEKWCEYTMWKRDGIRDQHCAYGHMLRMLKPDLTYEQFSNDNQGPEEDSGSYDELAKVDKIDSKVLKLLGVSIMHVNDGNCDKYKQDNPKDRVIACLRDLVNAGYYEIAS